MEDEIAGHINCSNWIAVKLSEVEISRTLNLEKIEEVSFEEALHKTHVNNKFENPNLLLVSPKFEDWSLIMGSSLMEIDTALATCKQLSKNGDKVFSFGVDIWFAYHSWIFAQNGEIKRYFHFVDGTVEEYGNKQEFEEEIDNFNDSCVFSLSEKFGYDVNKIKSSDLKRRSTIWIFKDRS